MDKKNKKEDIKKESSNKLNKAKKYLSKAKSTMTSTLGFALNRNETLEESENKATNIAEASMTFKRKTTKTKNTSEDEKAPSLNPNKDRRTLNLKDISDMRERGEFDAKDSIINGGSIKDYEPYLLSGFNLTNATIKDLNLDSAILLGTNLTGAKLSNVNLDNSICNETNFSKAEISAVSFIKSSCINANFSEAKLENTFFLNSDLKKADISGTQIQNSSFACANCYTTNFKNSSIKNTSLENTNCKNADFSGTEIAEDVICKNTYCRGAKIENANIKCDGIKPKENYLSR